MDAELEERGGAAVGRSVAIFLALALAALAYAFPLPDISEEGRRLTAVLAVVGTLWITEALPLAVTALLGPALAVLVGVASAEKAFASFGNPIMMLFVGSFLLARATFKHRLNERIAYRVLSLGILRNDPTRAFIFLGLTSAGLSAWMSNTAVTAMMLPVAQSVLLAMVPAGGGRQVPRTYAAALMLIVAYSASVGGLFTPIGTPPNLIGIGLLQQATGQTVTFVGWIARVFPVSVLILLSMMVYMAFRFRHEQGALRYDRKQMVERYAALGAWAPAEKRVLAALVVTIVLWVTPSLVNLIHRPLGEFLLARLPEAAVPLIIAAVLFIVAVDGNEPVLELRDLAGIDWPVIVLFGGGMCLGSLMIHTGMAAALGKALSSYVSGGTSAWLIFAVSALAVAVSETTSNTASANMVVPVVLAIAGPTGIDVVPIAVAATAACTLGFMLPVSTPTNALAYATGYVTQRQMIRWGALLDLIGLLLLTVWFGWII